MGKEGKIKFDGWRDADRQFKVWWGILQLVRAVHFEAYRQRWDKTREEVKRDTQKAWRWWMMGGHKKNARAAHYWRSILEVDGMSRWIVKTVRAHKSHQQMAHDVCAVIADALDRGIESATRKDTATISIGFKSMTGQGSFSLVAYPKDSASLPTTQK